MKQHYQVTIKPSGRDRAWWRVNVPELGMQFRFKGNLDQTKAEVAQRISRETGHPVGHIDVCLVAGYHGLIEYCPDPTEFRAALLNGPVLTVLDDLARRYRDRLAEVDPAAAEVIDAQLAAIDDHTAAVGAVREAIAAAAGPALTVVCTGRGKHDRLEIAGFIPTPVGWRVFRTRELVGSNWDADLGPWWFPCRACARRQPRVNSKVFDRICDDAVANGKQELDISYFDF